MKKSQIVKTSKTTCSVESQDDNVKSQWYDCRSGLRPMLNSINSVNKEACTLVLDVWKVMLT